jgi:hypothetical protein
MNNNKHQVSVKYVDVRSFGPSSSPYTERVKRAVHDGPEFESNSHQIRARVRECIGIVKYVCRRVDGGWALSLKSKSDQSWAVWSKHRNKAATH